MFDWFSNKIVPSIMFTYLANIFRSIITKVEREHGLWDIEIFLWLFIWNLKYLVWDLEYPLLYVMKNLYHGKRGKRYQFWIQKIYLLISHQGFIFIFSNGIRDILVAVFLLTRIYKFIHTWRIFPIYSKLSKGCRLLWLHSHTQILKITAKIIFFISFQLNPQNAIFFGLCNRCGL